MLQTLEEGGYAPFKLKLHFADEDREEIQEETQKQEDTFDQIGSALGDLKHMSHVRPLPWQAPIAQSTSM